MISIHALREEGDRELMWTKEKVYIFLSTPSVRRATVSAVVVVAAGHISIHALREEGDLSSRLLVLVLLHFYPRPPRGGRPVTMPK